MGSSIDCPVVAVKRVDAVLWSPEVALSVDPSGVLF
jgi:hypothetical protein